MADESVLRLARMLQDSQAELTLMRRVVARHIADGVSSGVPSAQVLARSLLTELDTAGLRVDVPDGVASRRCDTPGCERETPHVVVPCGAALCSRCGFENPVERPAGHPA